MKPANCLVFDSNHSNAGHLGCVGGLDGGDIGVPKPSALHIAVRCGENRTGTIKARINAVVDCCGASFLSSVEICTRSIKNGWNGSEYPFIQPLDRERTRWGDDAFLSFEDVSDYVDEDSEEDLREYLIQSMAQAVVTLLHLQERSMLTAMDIKYDAEDEDGYDDEVMYGDTMRVCRAISELSVANNCLYRPRGGQVGLTATYSLLDRDLVAVRVNAEYSEVSCHNRNSGNELYSISVTDACGGYDEDDDGSDCVGQADEVSVRQAYIDTMPRTWWYCG